MPTCLRLALLAVLAAAPAAVADQPIKLERPAQHQFILDHANLISPKDQVEIRHLCAALLREKHTPIVVVTIESMAKYGGAGMTIETFSRLLFDEWGVGQAKVHGQPWNTGILLVVSRGDRKARIELGAGWASSKDAECQQIMDYQIVPLFKHDDYSGGILSGVESLDKMARGLTVPEEQVPWYWYAILGAAAAVLVAATINVVQYGSRGWGWMVWAFLGVIAMFLAAALLSRRGGSGYDDGGSFDGGSSDGGGADGGW